MRILIIKVLGFRVIIGFMLLMGMKLFVGGCWGFVVYIMWLLKLLKIIYICCGVVMVCEF